MRPNPAWSRKSRRFLSGAQRLVENEPDTTAWFAIRMGPRSFAIFDAFNDERGRDAHLNGGVAKQLMAKAPQLFVKRRSLQRLDIIADKLPQ